MDSWQRVQAARNPKRPTASYYINNIFDDFIELKGDRLFGQDDAVVGGVATFMGRSVTIIGQEKGTTVEEKARVNFGCAHPEGYRKALRLMKNAEKFQMPILCFVDTQGAYCGIGAEERGMGSALAYNIKEMSTLKTPVISMFIGEGGSGGAIAIAVADSIAMLENSLYSILSPEGFASILWKDSSRAKEAATHMKITAREIKKLGLIDEVITEPNGGAHVAPENTAANLSKYIEKELKLLCSVDIDRLVERRYEKFREMGNDSLSIYSK